MGGAQNLLVYCLGIPMHLLHHDQHGFDDAPKPFKIYGDSEVNLDIVLILLMLHISELIFLMGM